MLGVLKGSVRVPAKAHLSGHQHSSLSAMVLMQQCDALRAQVRAPSPWGGSSPPWDGSFQQQWTAAESSGDPVVLPSGIAAPLADLGPGVL